MARQKLFTKAVERELSKYPLYSQDGKGDNAKVVVKFFHPYSNRTWYITEGNKMEDGSWDLYGLTDNGYGELEYGYLSGRELEDYNRRYIAGIERDMYWKGNWATQDARTTRITVVRLCPAQSLLLHRRHRHSPTPDRLRLQTRLRLQGEEQKVKH